MSNLQKETKQNLERKRWALFFLLLIFWSVKPLDVTAAPVRCEQVIFTELERLVADRFSSGSKDFNISSKFARELEALPIPAQLEWIRSVGSVYRYVPKKDPSPTASWHIGGRRLLDYAMMLFERYDLRFAKLVAEGREPRFAYDQFLRHQNATFGTQYQSFEILAFAKYLQSELRSMNRGGPAPTLALGGSFINGKARITSSDLDISVSDPQLLRFKNDWEAKLNALLRTDYPDAALTLEMHAVPATFYGKINPFVINIDANQINLLVFEPARIGIRATELTPGAFTAYDL